MSAVAASGLARLYHVSPAQLPSRGAAICRSGTSQAELEAAIEPYVIRGSVRPLSLDTFTAKVRSFHETEIARTIEQDVDLVRYAVPNQILRIIDGIDWRADRLT